MPSHKDIVTTNLHVPGYMQSSDPGAVGAGIQWIDTTAGAGLWVLKVRNAANSGWETVGGGGSHPNLATHDALGLATDAELAAHAIITGGANGYFDAHPWVSAAGVLEAGRYVDFHHTDGSVNDYDARLNTDGTTGGELYVTAPGGVSGKVIKANDVGSVITAMLAANAVTLAKMQQVGTDKLLGRDTAATGDVEEIAVGLGLGFNGSGTLGLANDGVTFARMQNIATARVVGRVTASSGDPEELTIAQVMALNPAINVQVFNANGTWTKPAGARVVQVEVIGCGGGGGGIPLNTAGYNVSGGGGGGGYARKLFAATALGGTEAVVVGAGGTAGATTPTAGGTGGTCSFGTSGTLVQATGGAGGQPDSAMGTGGRDTLGGAGGVGSGGDVNLTGSEGGYGFGQSNNAGAHAGAGGAAPVMSGMVYGAAVTAAQAAKNGLTYGGGGNGVANNNSNTTARAGGVGALGVVIVTTWP